MDIPLIWWRILADVVVVIHLLFIGLVLFGGFLLLRWKYLAVVHIPAVLWAVWVEFQSWICPLTPLENWLRQKAGMGGYSHSFIDEYLVPVIYPSALNREWQIVLGIIVLALNVAMYSWIWHRGKTFHQSRASR